MVAFAESAEPSGHAVHIATYDFHYQPFLKVMKDAIAPR